MKKCPYCAEEIQDEAIVCKHCGRDLLPQAIQQPQVLEKPKKKSNCLVIGFVIVVVLAILGYVILSSGSGGGTNTSSRNQKTTYTVTYEITGTASRASLTYENATGGTEQTEVSVPKTIRQTMSYGDFVYISAQNQGDSGSIQCRILIDGVEYKKSTSTGAYVIASCSGSVGGD